MPLLSDNAASKVYKMKYLLSIIAFLPVIALCQLSETDQVYQKGDHVLHLGMGYPNLAAGAVATLNTLPNELLGQTITKKGKAGPQFNFAYDYGLTQELSIGAYFGYASATSPTIAWNTDTINLNIPLLPSITIPAATGEFSYNVKIYSIGVKGVYHFTQLNLKNIDVYGVGFLGANLVKSEQRGDIPQNTLISAISSLTKLDGDGVLPVPESSLNYAGNLGARYFFNNNMGFYIEAGYGGNLVNAGFSWKFATKKEAVY